MFRRGGVGKGGVFQRSAIVSARFGGVGAWRVRRNSVFSSNQDRGYEDAVVFPGIGGDRYFDQESAAMTRVARKPVLRTVMEP